MEDLSSLLRQRTDGTDPNAAPISPSSSPTAAAPQIPPAPSATPLLDASTPARRPWWRRHLRLILVLAGVVTILGTGAGLVLFTNLKYKLPFFQAKESALVSLMYERLAKLNGADFRLTYRIGIGARDRDARVKETQGSGYTRTQEVARDTKIVSDVRQYVLAVESYADEHEGQYPVCPDNQVSCDPATVAGFKPFFGSTLPTAPEGRPKYSYRLVSAGDGAKQTYEVSFELKVGIGGNPPGKNIGGPKGILPAPDNKNTTDPLKRVHSPALSFLSEDYFGEAFRAYEDAIPDDLQASIAFTGRGFSLDAQKAQQSLSNFPDAEASLVGSGTFNSLKAEIDVEGKVVDNQVFYRVSKFPFIDVTQGNQGKWIKLPEENDFLSNELPRWTADQVEIVKKIQLAIRETEKAGVLTFTPTGKNVLVNDIEARQFTVSVNANAVPTWLEKIGAVAAATNGNANTNATAVPSFTAEEKQQLIERLEEMFRNITLTVALHPGTGDLMALTIAFRTLPPADSVKFKDRQFNSSLELKLWNHNRPPKITVPDGYIDQSELDREKLGLSKEAYADWQQAERVQLIRRNLAAFYAKEKVYPEKLTDATRASTDFNTGKAYRYESQKQNYRLIYLMNDAPQEPQRDRSADLFSSTPRLEGLGYNALTGKSDTWHAGENVADRFTPIADQLQQSTAHVTAAGKTDYDAFVAFMQASLVTQTRTNLESYRSKQSVYPATWDDLLGPKGAAAYRQVELCIDFQSLQPCEYQVENEGKSYTLAVSYGIGREAIDLVWANRRNSTVDKTFQAGRNAYGPPDPAQPATTTYPTTTDVDDDGDGLTNRAEITIGTDPKKADTDGDGYNDRTEYFNGYNPLGDGLTTKGAWTSCVNLAETKNCAGYCSSIGKTCLDDAVSTNNFLVYGAETWSSAAECSAGTGDTKVNTCAFQSQATDARWKCFCQ